MSGLLFRRAAIAVSKGGLRPLVRQGFAYGVRRAHVQAGQLKRAAGISALKDARALAMSSSPGSEVGAVLTLMERVERSSAPTSRVLVPIYLEPLFSLLRRIYGARLDVITYAEASGHFDATIIHRMMVDRIADYIEGLERSGVRVLFDEDAYVVVVEGNGALPPDVTAAARRLRELRESNHIIRGPLNTSFHVHDSLTDLDIIKEVSDTYLPWLDGHLPTNGIVLDIGCQIGSFSILANAKCPGTRVLGFEPAKDNFALAKENFVHNAVNGEVREAAVSDKPGHATLHLSPENTGGHKLHLPPGPSSVSYEVDVTTLAEILREIGEPVDVLKVDVEGSEHAILMPFADLLGQRVRGLIVEAGGSLHGDANTLSRFLSDIGFSLDCRGDRNQMLIFGENTGLRGR